MQKKYVIFVAAVALLAAGCTPTAAPPAAVPAPVASQAAKATGPTAAGIAADMNKVNNDGRLTPAQKQIMLDQMKHAQTMQGNAPGSAPGANAPAGSK